jgi:hypothetical protein
VFDCRAVGQTLGSGPPARYAAPRAGCAGVGWPARWAAARDGAGGGRCWAACGAAAARAANSEPAHPGDPECSRSDGPVHMSSSPELGPSPALLSIATGAPEGAA